MKRPNTDRNTFSMIDRSTFHENLEVLFLQRRLSWSINLLSNLSSLFSLWIRRKDELLVFANEIFLSSSVPKRCLHKVRLLQPTIWINLQEINLVLMRLALIREWTRYVREGTRRAKWTARECAHFVFLVQGNESALVYQTVFNVVNHVTQYKRQPRILVQGA